MTRLEVIKLLKRAGVHDFCWRHGLCTASVIDQPSQHGTVCNALEERERELLDALRLDEPEKP